jgi:hypothetical protein
MQRTWYKVVLTCLLVATLLTSTAFQTRNKGPYFNTQVLQTAKGGKLSFRLAALAQSPGLRTSSSLEEQAAALSLPASGAGSLMRASTGQLVVDVRMSNLAEANLAALRAAGALILHTSPTYRNVSVQIGPSNLHSLAAIPAVEYVSEALTPFVGDGLKQISAPNTASTEKRSETTVNCPQGSNVSEGDTQLKADLARSTYGLDGSGVSVGVISDSYDLDGSAYTHASDDVLSGDLPGVGNPCGNNSPVNVIYDPIDYADYDEDEGRAMLQIVHDLAPGASLSFASIYPDVFTFADNIRALKTEAHADIIVDDVAYYEEPFFQEGPVNVAISDVAHQGTVYLTAAGNDALLIGGEDVGSYETDQYRPMACPTAANFNFQGDCHDFDPGPNKVNTAGFTADMVDEMYYPRVAVDFQWAEPWYGVTDDLDIFLMDQYNDVIGGSNISNPDTSQTPFEYFGGTLEPMNYHIVINRYSGKGTPRMKFSFVQPSMGISNLDYSYGGSNDVIGPSIYGHSASKSGLSVAAVPYDDASNPEYFSSFGPAVHYFNPVVNTTPAAAISPERINQPVFAATDGGCTTFFGDYYYSCSRFYGTSAAAPHAAAVAALLKQKANQERTPLTGWLVKQVFQATAQNIPGGKSESVGAGLIDALGAINNYLEIKFSFLYLPITRR